jgi:succinyl-CoA synthetase beta subunit
VQAKKASRANSRYPAGMLGTWEEVAAGNVGILGNGAGLVMTTLDLVTDAGSKAATCLNLGHGRNLNPLPLAFGDRLKQGLEFLSQTKAFKLY